MKSTLFITQAFFSTSILHTPGDAATCTCAHASSQWHALANTPRLLSSRGLLDKERCWIGQRVFSGRKYVSHRSALPYICNEIEHKAEPSSENELDSPRTPKSSERIAAQGSQLRVTTKVRNKPKNDDDKLTYSALGDGILVSSLDAPAFKAKHAREAAFWAIRLFLTGDCYIQAALEKWLKTSMPSSIDFGLAKEIAVGTTRRLLTLERLSLILAKRPRLKLRKKERAILYSAIYQHCFMSRIPTYALVNEAVKLANQHCFGNFPKFVNAILRNMPADSGELLAQLPQGDDPASLSIRLSYPEYFVQSLCDHLGLEKAIEVMESMNVVPPIMARVINTSTAAETLPSDLEPVSRLPPEAGQMVQITNREQLTFVNSSPNLYITNCTPVVLLARLCSQWRKAFDSEPKRVLDLCASPGGKTIGLASAFPSSHIFANDISLPKVSKMHANFARYGLGRIKCTMVRGELVAVGRSLPAKATKEHSAVLDLEVSVDELEATVPDAPSEDLDLAQSLQSLNRDDLSTFDVVVVDAPCSNTGVLHKRPEARWRLSSPNIVQSLQATQLALVGSAAELVRPGGQIWYLTCSILPDENERLVDKACEKFGLERGPYEETILPSVSGADGGFASCLVKKA